MALTNPNHAVTAERLSEFYQGILPYLNGTGRATVYGMRILRDESNPSAKVEYIGDNVGYTPAAMDYTTGIFDYGSWYDAFFMPRPCMLKYDGTVDYYLDPNDYTKKEDGTASDVANTSYGGNAMMEWGRDGKKIWLCIVPDANRDNKEACIYIADQKINDSFTDWNFHNSAGVSVDHFYTPIYNGSLINGKLRSLSGQQVMNKKTAQQEYDYAVANNPSGSLIWTTETIADIDLINILLMMISKSTNSQAVFGQGLTSNGTEDINNSFRTGVHNDKGLFYGTNLGSASTYTNAVKIFGMENWWGLQSRRCLGDINDNGSRKRKLTYGQEDGSTVTGYNFTGSGYINSNVSTPSGTSGSYLSYIIFTNQGLFQAIASGSETTYYCDAMWFANNVIGVTIRGGTSHQIGQAGFLGSDVGSVSSRTSWYIGCALSARPIS